MTQRSEALHTLLTRLLDSRAGYEEAIEYVDTPSLKSTMSDLMERRSRNAAEVRGYLEQLGETVDDDRSLLARAHRLFIGFKDAVTGKDDDAVLAEVVRGEKTLRDAYDEAITAAGGNDPEFDFLVAQHDSLNQAIHELEPRHRDAA
ncbi:PA2169 family four-helix-bundle protein [Jannaschia sp. 2305UL9-9]|uniref:ferritin-like domain-containing protein n=1 Tax=Jannaschia sp. 2305UL9-9 TaxID=3121638 RepID=UPI0035279C88